MPRPIPRLLSAIVVGAAVLTCADPNGPATCTVRLDSGCWTNLGLNQETITSLADTPWGLFAGTVGNGVFQFDGGGHWRNVGLRLSRAYISSLLYVPTHPPRLLAAIGAWRDTAGTNDTQAAVYATEDARQWFAWDDGLDARASLRGDDAWGYSLAMDPGNPNTIYLGLAYPILRSQDGGRSWQFVWGTEADMGSWMAIPSLLVSPTRDGRVWAGGETAFFDGRILSGPDWGASWSLVNPTPTYENAVEVLAIDPRNPSNLWAGLAGVTPGVVRSTDGGGSWTYALHCGSVYGFGWVGDTLYAASTENFRPPPDGRGPPMTDLGMYRSVNGGTTWDTLKTPEGVGGAAVFVADARGALLVGTRLGVRGLGLWKVAR